MEKSVEMEVIEKLIKLLKCAIVAMCSVTVSVCVVATVFLTQYEYSTTTETETITVDSKNCGDAIYQNSIEGDNVIDGKGESCNEKNNKENDKEN